MESLLCNIANGVKGISLARSYRVVLITRFIESMYAFCGSNLIDQLVYIIPRGLQGLAGLFRDIVQISQIGAVHTNRDPLISSFLLFLGHHTSRMVEILKRPFSRTIEGHFLEKLDWYEGAEKELADSPGPLY